MKHSKSFYTHSDHLSSLSNKDVHRQISAHLSHLLTETIGRYKCDRQTVCDIIVKSSVEGTAIEGSCNVLRDAPTGMTVRTYLNDELSITKLQELTSAVCTQLQSELPSRLWNAALDLAADFHDEPFYGKDPTLQVYACRSEADKGTTRFYRVATIYVIHHQIPYTLGMVFVLPEYSVLEILEALLHQIQTLGLRFKSLCLDKGFCSQSVTTFLADKPYEVIMACPIRGKKNGTRALCKGRKSYFTEYTFNSSSKSKAYTLPLAVVRSYEYRQGKRRAVWLLYVILNFTTTDPQTIRARYRSRFGIETGYRCMRQTHAKTTSRNPALRFFLLGLAFLILNLWVVLRWRFCQIPRRGGRTIDKKKYELQLHRQFLAQVINEKYRLVSCIYTRVISVGS